MRKNIFFSLVFLFLFSSSASAKVSVDKFTFGDEHITILKGYMYELTLSKNVNSKNLATITKAIEWLETRHNDKRVFNLDEIKNKNSNFIKKAVSNINLFISGEWPQEVKEAVMTSWNNLGERVYIKRTKSTLTLKLHPFSKKETRHLVYRYGDMDK